MTSEERLLKAIFVDKNDLPCDDPYHVASEKFPDCCHVCKHGERYYRRIRCFNPRLQFTEIDDICSKFLRRER